FSYHEKILYRFELMHHIIVQTILFKSVSSPATSDTSSLSLHDALPIFTTTTSRYHAAESSTQRRSRFTSGAGGRRSPPSMVNLLDRKSTRLNSSHVSMSYAVFCLKKKKRIMREIY